MTEMLFAFDQRNYPIARPAFGATVIRNIIWAISPSRRVRPSKCAPIRRPPAAAPSSVAIQHASAFQTLLVAHPGRFDGRHRALVRQAREICVSHQRGYTTAVAGDFLVTKSITPFFIECHVGRDAMHEVLHVVVPTHLLTSYIPYGFDHGIFSFATGCQFTVAQHILTDIFEEEGELSANAAQRLVETALFVVSQAIGAAPGRRARAGRSQPDGSRMF